jgi:hypothetical protein
VNRKQLNHDIRALAHGKLGLSEEEYRLVVEGITGKQHVTDCDDEEAGLVLVALRNLLEKKGAVRTNPDQHRMIAKLGYMLKWTWDDIASFTHKVTGHRSTKLCSPAQLAKVIRGMIAVIDHDIAAGKLKLSHTEAFEFERHAKHHRIKTAHETK